MVERPASPAESTGKSSAVPSRLRLLILPFFIGPSGFAIHNGLPWRFLTENSLFTVAHLRGFPLLLSRRPKVIKWSIFHYAYGLLHHPGHRTKFADNLKRELPRIPFAPGFRAFSSAGAELAKLHLNYETLEPYPLKWQETPVVPLSYRVDDKIRLNKDKSALTINPSLALAGIPPETFSYRLGNRIALEWVIDQYRVSEDKRSGIRSDPNRVDDSEYIVRLIAQVVRLSVETVRIVEALPENYSGS